MNILHYSSGNGQTEYVVFTETATQTDIEANQLPGATLDGIYEVALRPRGTFGRQTEDALPIGRVMMRE